MWPFFQRDKTQSEDERRRPVEFGQISGGMGDFSDLKLHDVSVKFWLAQPVADALKEIKKMRGESLNETLLIFLLGHCYGFYFQQLMLSKHPEIYRDADPQLDIAFSNRKGEEKDRKVREVFYFVPELGKNIFPVKLWMPRRLKDDVALLAEHAGLSLSAYLREIVIARVFGHGMLPMRPEMLAVQETEAAMQWVEGRDVPWKEVGASDFLEACGGRTELR